MPTSTGPISTGEKLWSQRGLLVTVEDATGACRTLRFAKPFVRVGSDPRAELVLSGADIQPCHFYLHATDEGIFCFGLAARSPTGWLTPKLRIKAGGYQIRATFDDDGPPPRTFDYDPRAKDSIGSAPRLRLRLTGDKKHAFETNLRRQLTVMGRQAPSSLCVQHPTVSRTHAVLFWQGHSLWVVDLLSANGIRRDGAPLDAGALDVSQRLAVGDVRCRYLGPRRGHGINCDVGELAGETLLVQPMITEQRAEIAAFEGQLAKLRTELAATVQARELAATAAADHQRQLAELVATQTALQAELASTREELAASQEAIIVHQTAGEQRIAALREAHDEEIIVLRSGREAAELAIAEREARLNESGEALRRLEVELAAAKEHLAASDAKHTESRGAAEAELSQLRELLAQKLAAAVAAREAAEQAIAEREARLNESVEALRRLRAELAQTKEQLAARDAKQSESQAAATAELSQLRESLAQELATAVAAREAAEQAIAEREARLNERGEELRRLHAELAQTKEHLAASGAKHTESRAAAEAELAQLRESLTQELAAAVAAREAAEQAIAERELRLNESGEALRRLEVELAVAKQQIAARDAKHTESRAAAEAELAQLRESLTQELAAAVAAREAAEQAIAEREARLTESGEALRRLEAELATTRLQLAATEDQLASMQTADDERIAAEQALADDPIAVLSESMHQPSDARADVPDVDRQQIAETQAEVAHLQNTAVRSSEADWVLDDRVIGRLLDFQARERGASQRRKIFWGVAAGLLLTVLGAAVAAGRAWTIRNQPSEAPAAAESDGLIWEAFVKPGLR